MKESLMKIDKAREMEGIRDEKGHWKPDEPVRYAPLFTGPFRPVRLLKFLFGWGGYIFPRNILYVALAYLSLTYLQPPLEAFSAIRAGNIGLVLLRNMAMLWIVYGFYQLFFYTFKLQGDKGKYHPKWQEKGDRKHLFRSQLRDNIFRSSISGVPFWTAYEILYLYLAANGHLPVIGRADNPAWFIGLFFLIPLWRETHFYFIHRLIHWKPLLRTVHTVHHRNPNPGPWSGMSMHWIEHLLYFSCVLIHFVVPSHPMHFLFNSQTTALTPAHSHTGFQGRILGIWPVGSYFHYLHHKHVGCNFGEATIPWDKWLGRFYDGEGSYNALKKH